MVELFLSLVAIVIAAVAVYYAREPAAVAKGTVEPMRLMADGTRASSVSALAGTPNVCAHTSV